MENVGRHTGWMGKACSEAALSGSKARGAYSGCRFSWGPVSALEEVKPKGKSLGAWLPVCKCMDCYLLKQQESQGQAERCNQWASLRNRRLCDPICSHRVSCFSPLSLVFLHQMHYSLDIWLFSELVSYYTEACFSLDLCRACASSVVPFMYMSCDLHK